MERDGLNPTSLSRRLDGNPSQPQIHKFLSGTVREPKREMLKPIADFYKITIDALYLDEISTAIGENLKSGKPLMTGIKEIQESKSGFSLEAERIAELFDMIPAHDTVRRAQAHAAASSAILAVLQSAPATRSKSRGR